MKYLKTYNKIFESTESDLEDILLELTDQGYKILKDYSTSFDSTILSPCAIGIYTDLTYWDSSCKGPFLYWNELKDYALRIKDYLGTNYIDFKYKNYHGYGKAELNEDTEIPGAIYSFVIKYKN